MKKLPLLLLVLAATSARAVVPMPAGATYAKGATLTVAGYSGTALPNFPVLVRLEENSPVGFSYNDVTNAAAADKGDIDLCFVNALGSGLPFEIDTWDTNGESFVWVRLPSMANGTTFNVCWGSETPGTNVCNVSPWSDYTGVWHMNETNAAVTTIYDSTTNHLDGTTVATSSSKTDGKVGRARFITSNTSNTAGQPYDSGVTIDMTDDAAKLGVVDAVIPEFTASLWVRPQNNAQWWYFITRKASDKGPGWGLQNGSEGNNASFKVFRAYGGAEDDTSCMNLTGISVLAKQQWTKLDAVWMADKTFTLYTNGVPAGTGTLKNLATNGDQTKLALGGAMGPTSNSKNGRGVYGDMDEIRLRKGALSADWLAADYATQADPAFLTKGAAETPVTSLGPVASVSVAAFSYTNATVAVSVDSLGGAGAASVDVVLQLSTDDLFSVLDRTVSYSAAATGATNIVLAGLATNATYYARAVLTNSIQEDSTTAAVSFTTLSPGAPAGTASFDERGFTTFAATGAATAFGTGGTSAAMRLEASTDGFETVAAFSPEAVATLGEAESLTISGLAPDTAYSLRLRITNDWGVATFVALPDASTRDVPFATTGLGWTFSADGSTIDVTFGVSGVYDGATGSATLYFDASSDPRTSQGAQAVSAAETLSWSGLGFSADPMHAKVILSATLDGRTYSATNAATIAAGSTAVSVSDISEHTSAETAIRVHAGDVVTLPELSGTARYIVGNKLFGSLEGNVLTALRPGILGIHCVDNDSNTNTLAVLVLPEKIGNGDIYIFKDGSVGNNWCYWNETAKWEKLGSEVNDSWPHNPDDIAIIAFYKNTGVQFDSRADDIELAGLYAGGYCDKQASASLRCVTKQSNVLLTSAVRFRRSDGEPVLVQLCSNATDLGNNQFRTTFTVQDSVPFLEYASDTILSGGWDGTDSRFPQGRFSIGAKTNAIPEGVTVELVEMDTQGQSMGCTLSITRLAGKGTFWNRSSATMRVYGSPLFEGLLRDSGGYKAGTDDRTGPTYVRTDSLTNVAAEVVGWVGRSGSAPESNFTKGVGALVSGWPHFYNSSGPHDPWFPAKGTTMHGGLLFNRSENDSRWIATAATNFVEQSDGSIKTNVTVLSTIPDKRLTVFLDIADGFVYLRTYSDHVNYPTTWFEADDLRHGNRASLYAVDARIYGTGNATNTATILHGASAHAVGAAGDPLASNAYPIVPWIATQVGSKAAEDMGFAAFDGDGWLTGVFHEKYKALSTFGATDNAYVFDAGIALDEDLACNSLSLHNDRRDKLLGEGRTLTITSGGLILGDIDWDSTTTSAAIGAEDGGAANGALVLGDAEHPAYVWARGKVSDSTKYAPNEIWAPVTAPGGFVCAYTGDLVLGGNQTNIAEELVVNAGSLQLGTAAAPCRLARDLPIRVYANATLRIPNDGSTAKSILQFDGAAGWFGTVDLPDGVAAQVKKAYWRDYPDTPEWQSLERGFYGSSESGVEALATATHPAFVRDDLFSGTGTLKVVSDERIQPTLMILR